MGFRTIICVAVGDEITVFDAIKPKGQNMITNIG
jgi:hypothetical protein